MQDAGGAIDAEPTLTRPHRQSQQTANVVEARGVALLDRVLEASPGDQLALADDLLGLRDGLARGQPVADLVQRVTLGTRERHLSCRAGAGPAELLTSGVDSSLRHQPERRRLPAGDGEEARDAFARRVIEERMRAGHVSRFRDLRGVLEQRADTGPRMQGPSLAKSGHQLFSLVEEKVDISLTDLGLVGIGDEYVGGADHARGAERQEDVTVRRSLASIDTHVDEPVVHRDHQSHAGAYVDRAMSELRDLPGPGTRRVDDNSGMNLEFLTTALAANVRSHDPVAVDLEVENTVIRKNPRPVVLRRPSATPDQLPGVQRSVRNQERTPDVGVDAWLAAERLGDGNLLGWNARRPAALEEQVSVLRVVPWGGHEHAAGVLDAVRCREAENPVLGDALARG